MLRIDRLPFPLPPSILLALACAIGTVRTEKADGGAAVDSFAASTGPITLLEWPGDGTALAVAGLAGPVHVWSPARCGPSPG